MARSDSPLWTARVLSLFMAWAWSIIAFASAIHAVVKSNHDKATVRALAPPGTQVDIDDSDVFKAGAVITAVCIVIFLLTSAFLALLFFRPTARARSNTIQGGLLAFFATWLFATLVAYTQFFRTRSAVIRASLNGVAIPQSLIDALEKQNNLSPVYRKLLYLRLVAILPWFTLLFTIIASVILFMTASRSNANAAAGPAQGSTTNEGTNRTSEAVDEKEKEKSADSPTTA